MVVVNAAANAEVKAAVVAAAAVVVSVAAVEEQHSPPQKREPSLAAAYPPDSNSTPNRPAFSHSETIESNVPPHKTSFYRVCDLKGFDLPWTISF